MLTRLPKFNFAQSQALAHAFPKELFYKIQYEDSKNRKYKDENGKPIQPDSFTYIQLSHAIFISSILNHLPRNCKFLDIGCGAGDKLAITHFLRPDIQVCGLEYSKELVEVAKELCPFADIIEGDALKFENYREYDVLYSYSIFANKHLWYGMLHDVMRKMKLGAVLYVADIHHACMFDWDKNTDPNNYRMRKFTRKFTEGVDYKPS